MVCAATKVIVFHGEEVRDFGAGDSHSIVAHDELEQIILYRNTHPHFAAGM